MRKGGGDFTVTLQRNERISVSVRTRVVVVVVVVLGVISSPEASSAPQDRQL